MVSDHFETKLPSKSALMKATFILVTVLLVSSMMASEGRAQEEPNYVQELTITSATVDPYSGVVRLEGTVRCSADTPQEGVLLYPIAVSQQQGNRTFSSYPSQAFVCENGTTSDTFAVSVVPTESFEGKRPKERPRPGMATVSFYCLFGGCEPMSIEVRLQHSRG